MRKSLKSSNKKTLVTVNTLLEMLNVYKVNSYTNRVCVQDTVRRCHVTATTHKNTKFSAYSWTAGKRNDSVAPVTGSY
jgi:hypothetical protein